MTADQDLSSIPAETVEKIAPEAFTLVRRFKEEGLKVWLVGGVLRDYFSGKPVVDIDIVTDCDPTPFTSDYAKRKGLGFVVLDKERGTVRIAVKPRRALIDVNRLQGSSIEEDLARRDFTVNAVAALWAEGRFKITDPFHGLSDLKRKILRPVSEGSIAGDPLRILRAYRFRLALGLAPDPALAPLISRSLLSLPSVAGERISHELFRILKEPSSVTAIEWMAQDRVLDTLFPEVGATRGVTQNEWHHLDVFDHTIETYKWTERFAEEMPGKFAAWSGRFIESLNEEVSQGIPRLSILKLAALFHDTGKPVDRKIPDDGRVTFIGHDKTGEKLARAAASRLRLPGAVTSGLTRLVRNHLRPFNAIQENEITERAMYRFTRDLGEWTAPALILALGDAEATQGPAVTKKRRDAENKCVEDILRFIEHMEEKEKTAPPPVNGAELISQLGLPQGPVIGKLLAALREAYALGEIGDKEEALELAKKILNEGQGKN